jgi:CheY-like chemotaxis protein
MNPVTFAPTPPRAGSCVTGPSAPSVAIRKWRILVADDEEGIRFLSSLILAGGGFDVKVSADGEQAWDALSHAHYDLLITDNDMPRLTGMKLIERIRRTGMQLPVILASGTLPTASAREYLQLQSSEVLLKPFTSPELLTAVRFVLLSSYEEARTNCMSSPQPQPRMRSIR